MAKQVLREVDDDKNTEKDENTIDCGHDGRFSWDAFHFIVGEKRVVLCYACWSSIGARWVKDLMSGGRK